MAPGVCSLFRLSLFRVQLGAPLSLPLPVPLGLLLSLVVVYVIAPLPMLVQVPLPLVLPLFCVELGAPLPLPLAVPLGVLLPLGCAALPISLRSAQSLGLSLGLGHPLAPPTLGGSVPLLGRRPLSCHGITRSHNTTLHSISAKTHIVACYYITFRNHFNTEGSHSTSTAVTRRK